MSKPEPQLPRGTPSTLRGLSETFSFHSSPESFITSRIIEFQKEHPDLVDSRTVIRAKVLNRNVAVVSSYAQVLQVLASEQGGYEAYAAYDELMAPFFPSPNLLLMDGKRHEDMRNSWEARMTILREEIIPQIHKRTEDHLSSASSSSELDLYDCMKTLSWRILLGSFLSLEKDEALFKSTETLQETLLRGQFSLFPISLNTGFWHSPRKKGIDAKKKLQEVITDHFRERKTACPFSVADVDDLKNVANHTVLFTSSLAVKALASLLTALLLNLYLYKAESGRSLAESLASEDDLGRRAERLRSILMETERLSPPIVGVMRRSIKDNIISSPKAQADILVPTGWDCWLYFIGAGRDPAAFGQTSDRFDPDRYLGAEIPRGMAFGRGSKTCLGQETVHEIVFAIADTCLRFNLRMEGQMVDRGVQGWLGWLPDYAVQPQDWAKDMKQLPTQRPSKPVKVRMRRDPI